MTRPGLSNAEARLAESIDADALIADASALVRIPSWNGEETPAQEWVAARMRDYGLSVDAWDIDLDAVRAHPACSTEIDRSRALGVVGSLEGSGGGPTLLLNGHVDVVPPGDPSLWSRDPFSGAVTDGRLHGRGSLDMKGQLMAGLHAMRAVHGAEADLPGTVRLMSVVGEEDGGIGTLATILRGYTGDGAIVMEPTNLTVASSQAGCLNFRVRVPGVAAHGAVRSEGVSAIEKLIPVFRAIQALETERNASLAGDPLFAAHALPFPISIGTIHGGDWASSVPDHVMMEGRMGVAPEEAFSDARVAMEDAVARASADDSFLAENPPVVEWWGGKFFPARTARNHPLVTGIIRAATDIAGTAPGVEGVTFGADMGLLAGIGGTPTVLFGAGDIRDAHRPDESVAVDALVELARTLAVFVSRFCGSAKGDPTAG